MTLRTNCVVSSVFFCVSLFFALATASPAFPAEENDQTIRLAEHLQLGLKTQYMASSHTSYEFGNPEPPYQAPLSRLEFPLNAWWVGAEMRATFPRFSVGVEALTNPTQDTAGQMEDSDWTNPDNTAAKTIFSTQKCRLKPSYIVNTDVDLKVSDWLGLPGWLDLRPVTGFRWQNFNLVAHDGTQYDLEGIMPPIPINGDSIAFEQTYWQYFMGMRAGIDLGNPVYLKSLTALLQCDWAYVEGHNEDHHLMREGLRFTYENTYGQAWHGSIGFKAGLARHLALALDADFLAISTTGSHRYVNTVYDINETWSNGVRVWSAQNSLSLKLQYVF